MEKASETIEVAKVTEIPESGAKTVSLKGRSVSIFKLKNEYFAISNNCLHRGGPLGEGEVYGYTVTCPWHGWSYDVRTGSFDLIPTLKVKTFPVKVENGSVFIELDVSPSNLSKEF